MNLTTPIEIRATFDRLSYGKPRCPNCDSDHLKPPSGYALASCYSCGWAFDYVNGSEDEPVESYGGWVDPTNPWGGMEQDRDDDSCPPASVSLPFAEALEFLADFPGGIWGYSESESEQNIRTGDWKSVTAHVPDEWEAILFAALDVVAPSPSRYRW